MQKFDQFYLIRKSQKLIRIADKSTDDWRVVDKYVFDELASGSETRRTRQTVNEGKSCI